jgi:hypothetical protein
MNTRICLFLSVLATGITSLYTARILVPWNQHRAELQDGIKTQMGDLYSPWVGARELLLRHRNPYGPEVSHEIQTVFYGHAITQTYQAASSITNEQRFAYPVYAVFLLAPTVFADFEHVSPWARVAFGLLTAISVLLFLSILRWQLSWEAVTALVLFTLSSPQIVQGLRFEQLALVVGFLIAAAAWCVSKHHLMTAGALLALSTIKPQMALLPLCWFAVWTAGNWSKRWRLATGFTIMMTALLAAGELILPGWFGYFLAGIAAYRKYAPTSSLFRVALGETLGEIAGGVLVLALLLLAWHNRKAEAHSRGFITTFAAFLMGTILAFPLFTPFNQVLLIVPAMLLIRDWNALPQFSRLIFIISVSWPWIVSSVLLFFPPRLDSLNQLPLLPSFLVLFFPLLLPLLVMTRSNVESELQPPDCTLRDS